MTGESTGNLSLGLRGDLQSEGLSDIISRASPFQTQASSLLFEKECAREKVSRTGSHTLPTSR